MFRYNLEEYIRAEIDLSIVMGHLDKKRTETLAYDGGSFKINYPKTEYKATIESMIEDLDLAYSKINGPFQRTQQVEQLLQKKK